MWALNAGRTAMIKPTVLVLDDDAAIRDMVSEELEMEGYRVLKAADGFEGLSLFEQWHPDAIVLDLLMPRMSGFEFLHRLDLQFGRSCPVVVLSATLDDQIIKACLDAGVRTILDKPFSLSRLRSAVRSAVEKDAGETSEKIEARPEGDR